MSDDNVRVFGQEVIDSLVHVNVTERDILTILQGVRTKASKHRGSVFALSVALVPKLGERLLEMWVTRYVHRATEQTIKCMRFRNFGERDRCIAMLRDPYVYFESEQDDVVLKLAQEVFRSVRYDTGRESIEEMVFRTRYELGCSKYDSAVLLASFVQVCGTHRKISEKMFRKERLTADEQHDRETILAPLVEFTQAKFLAEAIRELHGN